MQAIPPSSTVLPTEVCVVRHALERHARERGDDTFAVFEDGGSAIASASAVSFFCRFKKGLT